MQSQIIPDAEYQQLNMSFSFYQHFQDKLVVIAIADHTPYHLQLNLDFDFQYIKSVLLSKLFKIISKTPEILKLKLSFANFEFKNIDKITLNTLKQSITQLNNKMIDQSHRNTAIEKGIQQFRNQLYLMTTKMTDLHRENLEIKVKLEQEQNLRIAQGKRVKKLCEQKIQELSERMNELQQQIFNKMEEERERNDKEEEKWKIFMEKNQDKVQDEGLFEQAILQMKEKIVMIEQRMMQIKNVQQKFMQLEETKHEESERLREVLQEKMSELEEKQLKKRFQEEEQNKLQSQRLNKLEKRVKALQNESTKNFEEKKAIIDNKLTEEKDMEKINQIQKISNIEKISLRETQSSRRQRHQKMGRISRTAICINGAFRMGLTFKQLVKIIQKAIPDIHQAIKKSRVDASFQIKFVIYKDYNSSEQQILQYSNFHNKPKQLNDWIGKIKVSNGWGNDAIELCFDHLNSLQKLNQFIIISDSKPITETQKRLWDKNQEFQQTFYETELKKLINKKVKGHSYYLRELRSDIKTFFQDISKRTNGKCEQFKIHDPNAAKMFTDFLGNRIFENMSELVSEKL